MSVVYNAGDGAGVPMCVVKIRDHFITMDTDRLVVLISLLKLTHALLPVSPVIHIS